MSERQGFQGRIGLTHLDSVPHWAPVRTPAASAPNVVYVVLDDVGFADLGCFGSEIDTPTIDGLAAEGLRYTNFHATPLCSPTRAALLTGRNHHSVGMRMLSNLDTGFPSGRGHVTKAAATLAEMLVDTGYNTMCVGKWHLAPTEHTTASGPYDQWPLGRGFERYYGFLEAETDQLLSRALLGQPCIEAPGRPEDGYHLTTDLVDQAISFVRAQTSVTPEKPFFLHLAFARRACTTSGSAGVPRKYRGRYDEGWDAVREARFARQKELGVIPPETRLPPRNDGVEPWADLTADERRLFARLQEAFAAMLDHTDAELRRFVDALAARAAREHHDCASCLTTVRARKVDNADRSTRQPSKTASNRTSPGTSSTSTRSADHAATRTTRGAGRRQATRPSGATSRTPTRAAYGHR